jgi:hypothetical protein
MTTIFTNEIEVNSFMGLVTETQKKNLRTLVGSKVFIGVESKEILRNLALATVIIIMGLTAGSVSQAKMEFAQYSTTAAMEIDGEVIEVEMVKTSYFDLNEDELDLSEVETISEV